MEGRIQKLCLAGIRTQRRILRVERTFMAPEYESTSRKEVITSKAARLSVLISSQET